MIERIEQYINGLLTWEEELNLWVEILKEPDYIDYLEIYLKLIDYFREENRINNSI